MTIEKARMAVAILVGILCGIATGQVVDLAPMTDTPDIAFIQGPPAPGPGGVLLYEYFALDIAHGDFNADGIEDIAFSGASGGTAFPFASVYIYYGHAVSPPLDVPMGTVPADVTIKASGSEAWGFGKRLAAGDVTGDGIDDLLIAAPDAPGGDGMPFGGVVFGLAGPFPSSGALIDVTASGAPLVIKATAAAGGDVLGADMAVGDLDGDGVGELALGAPGTGASGVIFVVDVDVLAPPVVTLSPGALPPGVSAVVGPTSSAVLGASLVIGDVDGSPPEELVAADPTASGATGVVWVFDPFGSVTSTIPGPAIGSYFGISLAIGDFDGNTIGDIAVGAPGIDAPMSGAVPARMDAGAAFVLYGPPVGIDVTVFGAKGDPDGVSNAPAPTLDTDDPGGLFGSSLAAGDVDLDGRDDLLIGAPYEDGTAGLYAGRAWLLAELAYAVPTTLDLGADPGRARTVIIGGSGTGSVAASELLGDFLGFSVDLLDFDGDDAADVFAGAPNDPFLDTGKVIGMLGVQDLLVGAGSVGSNGLTPKLRFPSGAATPGNGSFRMECRDAPATTYGLLLAGTENTASPFIIPPTIWVAPTAYVPFLTDGAGIGGYTVAIPPLPSLIGLEVTIQAVFFDPGLGTAPPYTASDAVTVRIL